MKITFFNTIFFSRFSHSIAGPVGRRICRLSSLRRPVAARRARCVRWSRLRGQSNESYRIESEIRGHNVRHYECGGEYVRIPCTVRDRDDNRGQRDVGTVADGVLFSGRHKYRCESVLCGVRKCTRAALVAFAAFKHQLTSSVLVNACRCLAKWWNDVIYV